MYYIVYKGRPYGPPMTRQAALEKLAILRQSVDGLEIAEFPEGKRIPDAKRIPEEKRIPEAKRTENMPDAAAPGRWKPNS